MATVAGAVIVPVVAVVVAPVAIEAAVVAAIMTPLAASIVAASVPVAIMVVATVPIATAIVAVIPLTVRTLITVPVVVIAAIASVRTAGLGAPVAVGTNLRGTTGIGALIAPFEIGAPGLVRPVGASEMTPIDLLRLALTRVEASGIRAVGVRASLRGGALRPGLGPVSAVAMVAIPVLLPVAAIAVLRAGGGGDQRGGRGERG